MPPVSTLLYAAIESENMKIKLRERRGCSCIAFDTTWAVASYGDRGKVRIWDEGDYGMMLYNCNEVI